jgi:hypothetical protein
MHGIELCEQERRTIRLSAPRWPFSPAAGSMLPGSPLAASCPEPVARNGFSLARNSCRLSATSIPGSKLPTCYFATFQVGFRARSALRLHYRVPDCAGCGGFIACGPLHFHHSVGLAAPAISTPLRDFYLPRDQSVQPRLLPAGPPGESARFPFAPRRPSWLKFGLRIIVPGPLRFRRLAVPQTSWNLFHYAPDAHFRQCFFGAERHFFLSIYPICS